MKTSIKNPVQLIYFLYRGQPICDCGDCSDALRTGGAGGHVD